MGIYATGPTPYLSLLARSSGFGFQDLIQAVEQEHSLVRAQAMRRSVFLLPRLALTVALRATRTRNVGFHDKSFARVGISLARVEVMEERIVRLLKERNLTIAEMKRALAPLDSGLEAAFGAVISRLCSKGRLVRGAMRGGWTSTLPEYALAENWLPGLQTTGNGIEEAQVSLARLYLKAYGPATVDDWVWWSGLGRADACRAWRALRAEWVAVKADGLPGEYALLEADAEDLARSSRLSSVDVGLLPVWDAYLMAYRERRRYLDPDWYNYVYDASGNATAAVLCGGRVAGVWDIELDEGRLWVKVALFGAVGREVWVGLLRAAQRLATAIGAVQRVNELRLQRCEAPPPLKAGDWNRFRAPLRGLRGEAVEIDIL